MKNKARKELLEECRKAAIGMDALWRIEDYIEAHPLEVPDLVVGITIKAICALENKILRKSK